MFPSEWKRESASSDYFMRPFEPVGEEDLAKGSPVEKPDWRDFLHIPFEPELIDRTPSVLLLPVDPYRIWAGMVRPPVRPDSPHYVLRILDVTSSRQRGDRSQNPRADYSFELDPGDSSSWFIPLWSSGRSLYALLGFFQDSQFVSIARSNEIRTPAGRIRGGRGRFLHVSQNAAVPRKQIPFPGQTGFFDDRPYKGYFNPSSPSSGSFPSSAPKKTSP